MSSAEPMNGWPSSAGAEDSSLSRRKSSQTPTATAIATAITAPMRTPGRSL
jgi:hypothetical protein